MMFFYRLYLGFPLNSSYQAALDRASLPLKSLLIQSASDYLEPVAHAGQLYLGKFLDPIVELSSLEASQRHIFSLLSRLVPDYPYKSQSLVLLAISE